MPSQALREKVAFIYLYTNMTLQPSGDLDMSLLIKIVRSKRVKIHQFPELLSKGIYRIINPDPF